MIVKTNHTTLFIIWCIALIAVLPITAALLESRIDQVPLNAANYWKWFIFWGVGIRLFFKGIRLASTPQITGLSITSFKNRDSYLLLLELGFANMALGSMGILSVINDQWRLIAAIAGAIYFGLTDMLRLLKKTDGRHERVALIYNILVFSGLVAFMVSQ
jgi:uncharacterized protein DUF6790